MRALAERSGYVMTRYQGNQVIFHAPARELSLVGSRSAVQRGEVLVVGDTIVFNDSTQFVTVATAPGDTVYLHDPSQGEDDIVARRITYDLARRRGTVTDIATSVVSGERWFVGGGRAGFVADSNGGDRSRFYVHQGNITSCDLKYPHYHFESRDIKVVRNSIMVARPAVLYIGDVPVLWLPFMFQDMRSGRRSGFLTPAFGVNTLLRSGSFEQRRVENVGYYFNLGDYVDSRLWVDWKSGARPEPGQAGYWRYNAESRYNWLDRFMRGSIAAGYEDWSDGTTNLQASWQHSQEFSQRTSLSADMNYAQNTQAQRQDALTAATALAVIGSQLNFQQRFTNFRYSLGGSRKQYSGRQQVDQTVPTLNITTQPLEVASWLTWTPTLAFTNTENRNLDQTGQFTTLPTTVTPGGVVTDSASQHLNRRNTQLNLDTPFEIFGFTWRNTIRVQDSEENYPVTNVVYDPANPGQSSTRVYERRYLTDIDWQTSVALPSLFQGSWNIVPAVSIQNVESRFGSFLRTERSGTNFVQQPKRLAFGVGASPTLFRLYPGFGPFTRFRHAISPTMSYSYAPAARLDDEFLAAAGIDPSTYLGTLAQSAVSLGLSTNLEAKWKPRRGARADSGAAGGAPASQGPDAEKIRLLSLNFSSLAYDFIRADTAGSGFTNSSLSVNAATDLLPGFQGSMAWSLFQGDPMSDTAVFKPYRTTIQASFSYGKDVNVFGTLARLFGVERAPAATGAAAAGGAAAADTSSSSAPDLSNPPGIRAAGSDLRRPMDQIASGQGWRGNLSFSSQRQRPPVGGTVVTVDPAQQCESIRNQPFVYQQCLEDKRANPTSDVTQVPGSLGGPTYISPSLASLSSTMSFDLTTNWAVNWSTSYDFQRDEFASHIVSLQRDLHDWRATFAFTQAPNGNFSFTFYVALKAEPDLKFDFDRQSYRGAGSGF